MPKYVTSNDSSARKLSFYQTVIDNAQKFSQIKNETEQDNSEEF